MSAFRPRARKVRLDRGREIQGVLAMQGLLSEDEPESAAETEWRSLVPIKAGGTEPRGGRRMLDVKQLPYRRVLADWPDEWHEHGATRPTTLKTRVSPGTTPRAARSSKPIARFAPQPMSDAAINHDRLKHK